MRMLTRAQAELVARVSGRQLRSPLRILDEALSMAGLSRSERRRLIAEAFDQQTASSECDERNAL
jgi:hypothetical protein